MTRLEQKLIKEQKEKLFIESIKNKKIDGKQKAEFRKTTIWNNFRKKLFSERKIDALTHKKLSKKFNTHHMKLSPEFYTELNEDWFELLGSSSHDIVHYLYGYYRKDKEILVRLKNILDKMVELNDGKDIKDFLK